MPIPKHDEIRIQVIEYLKDCKTDQTQGFCEPQLRLYKLLDGLVKSNCRKYNFNSDF